MALTKIQRNMIATGAVMPDNLVTTATYTVGALTSNGAITGTNIVATTAVISPKITVSGSSGLTVDTLRVNTSTWIAYYNPTSKELTYGPITGSTGTLQVFDQSLNTTDRVTFASVTATTTLTVGTNATVASTLTVGSSVISSSGGLRISGITAAAQNFGLVYNPTSGLVNYVPLPGQNLASTGSVTFANLTVTNVLKAGGNIYPTTQGSSGRALLTSGTGTLYWSSYDFPNQELNTYSSPTFHVITAKNPGTGDLSYGGSIYLRGWQNQEWGYLNTYNANPLNPAEGTQFTMASGNLKVRIDTGSGIQIIDNANIFTFTNATLVFPNNTVQSTAFTGFTQPTTTATFNTLYVSTGSQQNYTGGIRGGTPSAGGDLFFFAGANGYDGVIRFNASYLEPACSIIPRQNLNVNLGSSTNRWNRGWIKTLTVGTSTIYFEDDLGENTSTFSIDAGTVSIDNIEVLNQSVATGSSPTFSSIDATTSTFTDIVVNSELFFPDNTVQTTAWTGQTDRITSGTYNVSVNSSGTLVLPAAGFQVGGINANGGTITEVDAIVGTTIATPLGISNGGYNWSFESTGTFQFPNGTQQSTAWTGTVAAANVTGLATVATSGSYTDLTNKPYIPNQSVDSTSSPTFANLTVLGTMTTLNVTTENVTTENIVTQNFSDGTSQTTAWTGTVADSQITSVSTSKVNGLSVVGWTNQYGDLTGKPNQDLNSYNNTTFRDLTVTGTNLTLSGITQLSGLYENLAIDTNTLRVYRNQTSNQLLFNTSTVQFANVLTGGLTASTGTQVTRTVSAGGFPLNSNGTATVSTNLALYPSLMVSNYTSNITPNVAIRAYGQNRPNGTATTAPNPTIFIEGSRGTAASPTAVQAGDALGGMAVQGYDGANWPGDQNPNSYNYLGFYATENMTAVGTSTYQAGAGFNIFLQPAWTRPGLGATRQRMMFTSWTTSTTGPSTLNLLIGSGVDGTAPTMTMVDGTTYTGYGRANFNQVNTLQQFLGVTSQDTAPDNVTLTGTNVMNFVGNRRSGVSGRRNPITTGDDLGALNFRGQHVPNSTGIGLRGAQIFSRALEAFTSTRAGSAIGINTVNSATVVESSRLYLTDRENIHGSDSHIFRDKSNTFTALTMTTSSVAFNTGAAITTYNRTYGEFCYTGASIVATATNTIYAFPLNTTNYANGTVIQNGQQIKFNQVGGGFFKIIMSLQVNMQTNTVGSMDFWLRKNGNDVVNSATQVDLLKDQKAVIAMDWLVNPSVNDYYEIVYAVSDTNLISPWYAAQAAPYVRPAIPPIIVNVIPTGA